MVKVHTFSDLMERRRKNKATSVIHDSLMEPRAENPQNDHRTGVFRNENPNSDTPSALMYFVPSAVDAKAVGSGLHV